jgi:hypothetical protein
MLVLTLKSMLFKKTHGHPTEKFGEDSVVCMCTDLSWSEALARIKRHETAYREKYCHRDGGYTGLVAEFQLLSMSVVPGRAAVGINRTRIQGVQAELVEDLAQSVGEFA